MRVPVQLYLDPAVYAVWAARAEKLGTQVHTMLEHAAANSVHNIPRPPKKHRETPKRTRVLELLHDQSISLEEIAAAAGCSPSYASQVAQDAGIKRRRVYTTSLLPADLQQIRELHSLGWSDSKIAARLGRAQSVISRARHNILNLPTLYGGGGKRIA